MFVAEYFPNFGELEMTFLAKCKGPLIHWMLNVGNFCKFAKGAGHIVIYTLWVIESYR